MREVKIVYDYVRDTLVITGFFQEIDHAVRVNSKSSKLVY